MKSKILISCILFSAFQSLDASSSDSANVKQEVNHYFKVFKDREHFTAMSASVFIPEKMGSSKGGFTRYSTGTVKVPPPVKPVKADALFEIGSITKSFIAAILLQLEGEGKLSLDDSLGEWLPQYPTWKKVSLRRLLNMTSGIPSYTFNEAWVKQILANPKPYWSPAHLLDYANPEKDLPSGEVKFEYSNTNYILAGMVIEKATGQTVNEALTSRIFNPFQLKSTWYLPGIDAATRKAIHPRLVQGYSYDETSGKLNAINHNLSWAGAAGAIVSDIADLGNYVKLLYEGELFAESYRQEALKSLKTVVSMKTAEPLQTVDKTNPRGFGLGIGYLYSDKLDNKFYVYEGSTQGFRAFYVYSPCNQVIVTAMLNSKAGEGNPTSIQGDHLMDFSLGLYTSTVQAHPDLQCKNP